MWYYMRAKITVKQAENVEEQHAMVACITCEWESELARESPRKISDY